MKKVLITGCASGFGRDLVEKFLERGYFVIATMRKVEERRVGFLELERKYQGQVLFKELDITKKSDREKLVSEMDSLDLLINNAGFGLYGALEDMQEAQMRAQMEVNFIGTSMMIRDFLPLLRKSQGKIINISSMLGNMGMPLSSAYSASKFALEGLLEGLIYELKFHQVQICNICPGRHRTSFMKNLVWAQNAFQEDSPYAPLTKALKTMMEKFSRGKEIPLSNVSTKVVQIVQKKRMPNRVFVGSDAKIMNLIQKMIPKNICLRFFATAYNSIVRKKYA